MGMQDPIADMLTRIRNAQASNKSTVQMPFSQMKLAIAQVFKDEGYIADCRVSENEGKKTLMIALKYYQGRPVIEMVKRVSRPGLRVYRSSDALPKVKGGLGVTVLSTSKGVISSRVAKQSGVGGEVLCMIS